MFLRAAGIKAMPGRFMLCAVSTKPSQHADFDALAVPMLDALLNFAQWLTHDRDEAEDLVQETYLRARKGFGGFRPGTNFRAWIFQVSRNLFLTSRTGLQARMTDPLEESAEESLVDTGQPTPEQVLVRAADQREMQAALESLSAPHREVLLLCEVEEMSYQEIAQVLSVPIGTVMSRLARARSSLRQALARAEKGGLHAVS
jgi:RNA polymerase sigma-70 factor, ECF subfamily